MNKWDESRQFIDEFDLEKEKMLVDLSKPLNINKVIKDNKKFSALINLGSIGVHSFNRAILTPKENRRQQASLFGLTHGIAEANKLLRDAEKYEWKPEVVIEEFSKLITNKYFLLQKERKKYNPKNLKSIYDEMFITVEIETLIQVWQRLYHAKD